MIAIVAALGLLAVAVVLAVVVFSSPREVGEGPSPTPMSSSTDPGASALPRPSTAPSQPIATPSAAPAPTTVDMPFAAVSLVNDLRVREEPADGAPLSALSAGQVVMIDGPAEEHDGTDWYHVSVDESTFGWVSAGPEDDPYLELHRPLARQVPSSVQGIAGGQSGYLAWGVYTHESTEPGDRFVATSSDGLVWEHGEVPAELSLAAYTFAAEGPSGWVLLTTDETNSGAGGLWRASDGLGWEAMDLSLNDGLVPTGLVGHSAGYAMGVRDDRSGTSQAAVLVSADGSAWEELPIEPDLYAITLAPMDVGFVAWAEGPDGIWIRASQDGRTWTTPEGVLAGSMPRAVVYRGDVLVIASARTELSEVQAWRSAIGQWSWQRQPQVEAILDDISLEPFVASSDSVLIGGRQYTDGDGQWWRSTDGASWQRVMPTQVDVSTLAGPMASSSGMIAAVALAGTPAGPHPAFIVTHDGVQWTDATDPGIPVAESAVVGGCPEPPDTMLEWLAVPGTVGAECFAQTPITFPTWSTVGGGCGGFAPGQFEPAWLAPPFASYALILSPIEVEYAGCGSAAVSPGTELPDTQQWVMVTGHWSDPAWTECQWIPDPQYPTAGESGNVRERCRTTFVATSVTPTEAP